MQVKAQPNAIKICGTEPTTPAISVGASYLTIIGDIVT
jgi:hypothetical protein